MNFRIPPYLGLALKLIIFVLLLISIYQHLLGEENLEEILSEFQKALTGGSAYLLPIIVLLMFANWGLEGMKWKLLMQPLAQLSILKSVKAVFSGIGVSLFTPNRIGEFAGRILYLDASVRLQAISLTLLGSLGQFAVSFTIGIWTFWAFCTWYYEETMNLAYALPVLGILVPAALLSLYFKRDLIERFLVKGLKMSRFEKYVKPISLLEVKGLKRVLFYSLLRYAIFTFQYLLLLKVFGVNIPWTIGIVLVSSIFFTQTMLPTVEFLGILLKGQIALFFLSYATDLDLSILAAAFLLWIVNLMFPALLGSLFLWGVEIDK